LVALSSHYLLTPISIIQNAISLLQEDDGVLDLEHRRRLYDSIFQGQQRLWILAERFVIVGEIEDVDGLHLIMKVADVAKMVGDSIASVDAFAREKKVTVTYIEQLNVTSWEGHVDQRRMRQAVIAVLDNAVRFSQEGGAVRVSLNSEEGNFRLEVADAGIGMPQSLINELGQPLSRGTSMYNFDYEGIGLGLYVANEVVRAHGGLISFDSKLKVGTAVTITFPSM
jgi:signal transduction histidine kinase